MNRRDFVKQSVIAGIGCSMPGLAFDRSAEKKTMSSDTEFIWGCLLHLSFNFAGRIDRWGGIRTEFETDEAVWDAAINEMSAQKINLVLINLDDSILWRTHPDIALQNAWTPEKMREKLERIRKLGIEPVPMLNFSTTHDAWLGKYSRMVSTTRYYEVCKDLIGEAIELFDSPRFIHLGMDEETYAHQQTSDYVVIRQKELWWADLYFYLGEAMKHGVRPWIWADFVWNHPDEFFRKMPKSVLLSNWYYAFDFNDEIPYVKAYVDLHREGYDQIPTDSFNPDPDDDFKAINDESIVYTVDFCSQHIAGEHLKGFLQTFWMPTTSRFRPTILRAIELVGKAKTGYLDSK